MTFFPGLRRRYGDRIGSRMAFLLAVALLPLGAISVLQSHAVLREAEARSEAALTGETMRAAEHEVRLIQKSPGRSRGSGRSRASAARDGGCLRNRAS